MRPLKSPSRRVTACWKARPNFPIVPVTVPVSVDAPKSPMVLEKSYVQYLLGRAVWKSMFPPMNPAVGRNVTDAPVKSGDDARLAPPGPMTGMPLIE